MTQAANIFGQRLRILRESRGISVRGLAGRTGVSAVTIWKWEKGEASPRPQSLASLADALGVTSDELNRKKAKHAPSTAVTTFSDGVVLSKASQRVASRVPVQPSIEIAATIARAKQMIAEASGTKAANITIRLEF